MYLGTLVVVHIVNAICIEEIHHHKYEQVQVWYVGAPILLVPLGIIHKGMLV